MNVIEVDGRITALIEQRNAAQNQVVLLGGQLAVLRQEVADLQKRLAELAAKEAEKEEVEERAAA